MNAPESPISRNRRRDAAISRTSTAARRQRPLLYALLLATLLLSTACASTPRRPLSRAELSRLAAERGIEPEAVELPFAVDDEMRAWLAEIGARGPADRRLTTLLSHLLSKDGLGIRYDDRDTGTAAEVFRSRHGNCLGFTQLFVALGRELGVPVYFLVVEDVESYEKRGDLVVLSGHVTAGVGPTHDLTILEFSLGPEVDYRRVRPVSDLTAVALFYSNRGAELLTEGETAEALASLQIAVRLDPELPSNWVNLGVARRRSGDQEGAAEAYRKALEIDPEASSAYQNLAALLRLQGRTAEAEELLQVVARTGSRNPYSYLDLGDLSLGRGRVEEARRFYRRAQRLYRDHPEPLAALGLAALAAADRRGAQRWLAKARRLDPDNPRVLRLAQRLSSFPSAPVSAYPGERLQRSPRQRLEAVAGGSWAGGGLPRGLRRHDRPAARGRAAPVLVERGLGQPPLNKTRGGWPVWDRPPLKT